MKTRKKLTFLLTTALLIMPEIIGATKYITCGDNKRFPLLFAQVTSNFITIIKVLVPIFLVIGGMIAFFRVTIASNVEEELKKAKDKLINRIVAAVVIFFTLSIINFAVSLVAGTGSNLMSCINCFMNPDKCPLENEVPGGKICPGFITDQSRYDEDCNLIDNNTNNSNNNEINNNNTNQTSNGTTTNTTVSFDNFLFIGDSRYNGISTQLKGLGQNITVSAVDGKSASDWLNNTTGSYALPDSASGVSVMLGVNNPAGRESMKTLISNLHSKYPNAIIYINSVYHLGTSYNGPINNQNIDAFNLLMKEYADLNDWCKYIDVTNGLNDATGYIKSEYTNDGLHLNETGKPILINNIKTQIK